MGVSRSTPRGRRLVLPAPSAQVWQAHRDAGHAAFRFRLLSHSRDAGRVGGILHARRATGSLCGPCRPGVGGFRTLARPPSLDGRGDFRHAIAWALRPVVSLYGMWLLAPPFSPGPASGASIASGAASGEAWGAGSVSHARRADGSACGLRRHGDKRSLSCSAPPSFRRRLGIWPHDCTGPAPCGVAVWDVATGSPVFSGACLWCVNRIGGGFGQR